MKRAEMIATCKLLLLQLDELQSVLGEIPKGEHKFIFGSVPAARELLQIGYYETVSAATPAQTTHINGLMNKVNSIIGQLPQATRKQFKRSQ